MRDPRDLYELDPDIPELSGAVLLHQFDGFMDAGAAGKGLTAHLLDEFEPRLIARFDVDRLIDYRSNRPPMTFMSDRWADFEAPELAIYLLHDATATPFLLLTGPEPDREWELFVSAVRELIEDWDVRLTVGFHGIPMGVPHTRPLGVTAHATRQALLGPTHSPWLNTLQVPGNISALLELRLGESGHDAMGYAAHVPHYLAQATYPASSLVLLDALQESTGLALPAGPLLEAAEKTDAEIAGQVRGSEEVADVVAALERQYDVFSEAQGHKSLLAETTEHMPTADELASEFERFLAEQSGSEGPTPS
ncbi:hypothetical protein Afil01_23910 [Actinorhabdospora filicis]|uniref:PAC2 family protein n=1 Tax=Actinorhabdospora filicis TaxID=1785913 RepID=A0A9W6W8H1_9ACTN|nr:PAC2 family protein [Actinorhabdospora filicis]GLZ77584.1 hypothetical protein Afil01_23910 [Actinorhabdospora filicis]